MTNQIAQNHHNVGKNSYMDSHPLRKNYLPTKLSHGLVVMGRDSRSKGCGFESRHRLLDGHFHINLL